MNFPIAERELRTSARMPRMYRARLVACVIFGAITMWMFWFMTRIAPLATIAAQTYSFISHVALMMCLFSANATADALSAEKRNGTLGLLFLTDLKGADIVFGKLAAAGLLSFYGLLAVLPILALPILMGGITGQSVFRTAITLTNALFFGLSLGLWVSSRSWDHKRAINGVVWLAVTFLWLIPGLATAVRYRFGWGEVADFIYMLSPVYQQDHSNPYGVGMARDKYWISLGITHALGWLALWRACAVLPRSWQDRVFTSFTGRWKKFWHDLRFGSAQVRRKFRQRLLNINAVHWLSAREKSQPLWAWAFIVMVCVSWALFWAWLRFSIRNGPPFWGIGVPAVLIMMLGLCMRACALAAEVIARDRFSGALELLLSTTLTEREVARGQWLTFARTLVGPALAAMLIGVGVFIAAFIGTDGFKDRPQPFFLFFGLATLFPIALMASVWTGMWTGCITRTPAGAPALALLRLLALPQVVFVSIMTSGIFFQIGGGLEFPQVFAGWWTLCAVNSLYWLFRSRRNFYARLRITAAERYQPQPHRARWWRLEFKPRAPLQNAVSSA